LIRFKMEGDGGSQPEKKGGVHATPEGGSVQSERAE
jgi:hypothetical protein